MNHYEAVNILDMLNAIGEDAVKNILSVGVPAIREAPVQYRGTENLGPMWPEAYRSASLPDGAFFSGSVWTFSPCSRMVCKIEGFF